MTFTRYFFNELVRYFNLNRPSPNWVAVVWVGVVLVGCGIAALLIS